MTDEKFSIFIDGSWSAKEMADLFLACDIIYHQIAVLKDQRFGFRVRQETDNPTPTGNQDGKEIVLRVACVSYASPGRADLVGAGELVGHLKDFLLGLLDRVLTKKDRQLDRTLRSTEIEAATLENYARFLEVMDNAYDLVERRNLPDHERQHILNQVAQASRMLGKGMAEGRITSVSSKKAP